MSTKISKTRNFSCLLAMTSALAITAGSVPAFADSATGTPSVISYTAGILNVPIAGVNYYGQLTPGGTCGPFGQTVDTLKAWQSLAQSALLSGKTLTITFTNCQGFNFITVLNLNS
jgi:hypothetical protein